jgi:predicted MFS family arabinose efflux permease
MMCNVGRMIAAMAMVTSSVVPQKRGAFLSVNASLQHVASGIGAYLGGIIVTEAADGRILHYGAVGWFGAACTISTLWLASRVRIADQSPTSAEAMSLAVAAEASADAPEPVLSFNEFGG